MAPGDTPYVRLQVSAGARLELQGGSLSLQGAALSWKQCNNGKDGISGDLEFDGTMDVAPPVTVSFDRAVELSCGGGGQWPWKTRTTMQG